MSDLSEVVLRFDSFFIIYLVRIYQNSCRATEDDDATAMDGVRFSLRRSAELLGWKNLGEVLVHNVHEPGDIDRTDGCRRAAELAKQF